MRDLITGIQAFGRGFSLLGEPRIRRLALIPIGITTVLFAGLIWFGAAHFASLVDRLVESLPDQLLVFGPLLWVTFGIFVVAVLYFAFVMVAAGVAAPFNGALATAVERHLTGAAPEGDPWPTMLRKLPGTLIQELRKLIYACLLAIPFLLLFLLPGINLLAPLLWFAYCAWIAAFSFTDYAMANHGRSLAEVRRILGGRRLLVLGFGGVTALALGIPVLNLFALPAAACGGTVLWVEQLRPQPPPPPPGS